VRIDQRAVMLSNMGPALSSMKDDVLARSHYISKMTAASAWARTAAELDTGSLCGDRPNVLRP
jgi:hypothetical protein